MLPSALRPGSHRATFARSSVPMRVNASACPRSPEAGAAPASATGPACLAKPHGGCIGSVRNTMAAHDSLTISRCRPLRCEVD
jgi:hypothetical protein